CSSPNICDCYPEYCNPSAGQAQKLEDTSKPRYNNNNNNNNNNATDNENTIIATYDRNFSSTASSLTAHDNMLVAWRSNYGWATICGSSSTLAKHQDGAQCLKVSSSENGKQAVVRVVQNECSNPSMVLDYDVFQQLHNGGANAGNAKDQLLISYMYVHCMDY
ncbi:Wound-induced protein WIN2, partial [Linum grandiflorum]